MVEDNIQEYEILNEKPEIKFDAEKYLKQSIEKHPDLELNEQADTHSGVDGHVYNVRNAHDGTKTCVITTAKLGDEPEKTLKERFEKVIAYLGEK